MKRIAVGLLLLVILMNCTAALAKSKKMDQDLPQWTEETVRQYVLDYIEGTSMERLWSYFDLQIRRYMPEETFRALLMDIKWMTGEFLSTGSYRCFEEPETGLKVHVQHLCMEKQDLDVYFSHKNEPDDWEVMAVEFVPAVKEGTAEPKEYYTELEVTTGTKQYPLQATITLPVSADEEHEVIGCVLVHDDGAFDQDMAIGQTKLFADFADDFGKHNIATIRYEKRAYAYPETAPYDNLEDEVIADAVAAAQTLAEQKGVDSSRIVVIGVGFGAELCPRIAQESDGSIAGIIMIGANGVSKLQQVLDEEGKSMTRDEQDTLKKLIRSIAKAKDEELEGVSYRGRDGFFYRELAQNDQFGILSKLAIPTYIIKGRDDPYVSDDDGRKAYYKKLGISSRFADYYAYRGLNHLLMNDLSLDENGKTEYKVEAHLDHVAAQDIRTWLVKALPAATEEE